ncbi:hypothetical protein [Vibrio sp. WXL103]|uniref:hypothetical protein n=1 Tax=unclassified Vibrio TaxID=2614977 RepID=UPI003EC5EC53
MHVKKINDKQIREMMMEQPKLFPGMISTHFYIGIIRQEMALYEHQANPSSVEQLLSGYLGFKNDCLVLPEF